MSKYQGLDGDLQELAKDVALGNSAIQFMQHPMWDTLMDALDKELNKLNGEFAVAWKADNSDKLNAYLTGKKEGIKVWLDMLETIVMVGDVAKGQRKDKLEMATKADSYTN